MSNGHGPRGIRGPGGPLRPVGPTGGRTYTVQRGDTLSEIAKRHGVSLQDLLRANP
ncbi:MAG: LysM peptidoglycan-binding domain-containing protein, partial [Acidobacteria bacterium]|nr:LysM peptidoglycan-binding domain-containing protein [Acidobacteriota bacterium]MDW7985034.1 LysM domain-containing protein [Acidobacteriota bacterium]